MDKLRLHRFITGIVGVLVLSAINIILYHIPFFKFVLKNSDYDTFDGKLMFYGFIVFLFLLNTFVFYIVLLLLRKLGKIFLILLFNLSAVSVYFINTYQVMITKDMIGNVFNSKYEEASSFVTLNLFLYIIFLGVLPSVFIWKLKLPKFSFKGIVINVLVLLFSIGTVSYINKPNWIFVNVNHTSIKALVMPWSHFVNTIRYFVLKNEAAKKAIILPDAEITNSEKSVVVLVLGESARSQNFSLYGYKRETNPLMSKIENLKAFKAKSCETYTIAGVKCILDHKETDELYEDLPSYLHRCNVDVYWKTVNWGEPKMKIANYIGKKELLKTYNGDNGKFDEILIHDLKKQILESKKDKILIVLHTYMSHGPNYFEHYPKKFEKFYPVCKEVELKECDISALINAYDNTIVYTDYIINQIIEDLKELGGYKSSMIFISDHGESLGEDGVFMHGLPKMMAPNEQFDIPFIVWTSENNKKLKDKKELNQHHIFHSVLRLLDVNSPIYDEEMSIFK